MTDRTLDEDTDAAAETGEQSEPRSGSRKRLAIFGVAALLLLAMTGGVLSYTGLLGKFLGSSAPESAGEAAAQPPRPGVFYDLPDLLVNLNSTGRKASFLKISVSLEVETQGDIPRLQAVMPRIIDNFQVYLRELRVEDLRGSGGIYRLREELLARVNSAAAPVKVRDVLFKEMLVQ
ncbi:MAG: flagellar basal body-associated FliL family protein [Acidobacteriota bacterium]